jgi:hypothetical protein
MRLPLCDSFRCDIEIGGKQETTPTTMGFLDPSLILYALFSTGILAVFGAYFVARYL